MPDVREEVRGVGGGGEERGSCLVWKVGGSLRDRTQATLMTGEEKIEEEEEEGRRSTWGQGLSALRPIAEEGRNVQEVPRL